MAGESNAVPGPNFWPRLMLTVLIGVPAVGYVVYYMRKQSSKSDQNENEASKKQVATEVSVEEVSLTDGKEEVRQAAEPETALQKALKLKENGNEMYKAKKFVEAIRCYSEAIEICPESDKEYLLSALYQNRAAAYEFLNDFDEVISNCTEAIKLKPTYLKALLRRYKAYEKLGKLKPALEDVTASCILQQFANNEELYNADRILKALGMEEAEKYMKVKPAIIPSADFIKHYFNSFTNDPISKYLLSSANGVEDGALKGLAAAKKAMRDADYENVISLCTDEIKSTKESGTKPSTDYYEALLLRGTMTLLTSQDTLSKADLTEIIEAVDVDPKVAASALLKRAGLFMQDIELSSADNDYETALQIDPGNSDIYHQRAQMLLMSDNIEAALEQFEKAYALNPNAMIVLVQKLYAEYKQAIKNQNKAKAAVATKRLDEAVKRNLDVSEGHLLLAQIYKETEEYDKANEAIDRAIKSDPRNATIHVHKGLLLLQWKTDIDGAVAEMEKAIKLDPKCEFAYETLASVEVHRGNLLKAFPIFDQALPLTKCLREAAHILSLKAAAEAQHKVSSSLGITFQM